MNGYEMISRMKLPKKFATFLRTVEKILFSFVEILSYLRGYLLRKNIAVLSRITSRTDMI